MKRRGLALLVMAIVAGCSDNERTRREPPREMRRERRVIEPPSGTVRPLPPHAIRADGVGPYRLGEPLSSLLQQLASGPRMIMLEIPGLVHQNLIRAEDSTVLIGGEPGGVATSVAVVGPEVARTESGIHVGSTRAEVEKALAPFVTLPERAVDPRLLIPRSLPNARFLLDDDRVIAIVVMADGPLPAPGLRSREPSAEPGCVRPASTTDAFGACLTAAGELVEVDGNQITIRAAGTERVLAGPLRLTSEIVFAGPLRAADGRDELVIVLHAATDGVRQWSLVAYRFEGGKLTRSLEPSSLYQLSSANARWIGAEIDGVDLYLSLHSRPDAIEAGGLLSTRPQGDATRDIAVITPVMVPRRPAKPVQSEVRDAGPEDAQAGGIDATRPGARPAGPTATSPTGPSAGTSTGPSTGTSTGPSTGPSTATSPGPSTGPSGAPSADAAPPPDAAADGPADP